jgi:hypothetical protein
MGKKVLNNFIAKKKVYFQKEKDEYILKKKAAANNGYNGNSSHAVATACSRGRSRSFKNKI